MSSSGSTERDAGSRPAPGSESPPGGDRYSGDRPSGDRHSGDRHSGDRHSSDRGNGLRWSAAWAWALVATGLLLARAGDHQRSPDPVGLASGPGLIVGVEDEAQAEHRAAPLSLPIHPSGRGGAALRALGAALCCLGLLRALQHQPVSGIAASGSDGRGPAGSLAGSSAGSAGQAPGSVRHQPLQASSGQVNSVSERATPIGAPAVLRRGARMLWAVPGILGVQRLARPSDVAEGGLGFAALLLLLSLCLLAAWRD